MFPGNISEINFLFTKQKDSLKIKYMIKSTIYNGNAKNLHL